MVVCVRTTFFGDGDRGSFREGDGVDRAEVAPVQDLFQVNQEAREVALRKYRLKFTDVNTPSKPLYFNPDKDSLHLSNLGLRFSDAVWEEITASSPRLQDLALVKYLITYTKSWAFDNGFSYRPIAYESLETSIPGNMREHGVAAAQYDEFVRAAIVEFWATEMNPRKSERASPPHIPQNTFLTWAQVDDFGRR
ncbi:hypothetical protein NA56DRAFT_691138 [Hyaloscypha hepaticicola]|uniref:2EXR domain-containing protein n=1 Tax=Hyaloscypha hepaticicola TaxID=2082293 RepID=A0A2J6PWP3_9HELO|nr:hypothetical protein NA56DRAFT_691138 [Hyaloscypha hepaticicola]